MANRFILNETSYFGPGSISVIPDEVAARGFKKAFVVTDKSLMQFKVATKVLKVLDDAKGSAGGGHSLYPLFRY